MKNNLKTIYLVVCNEDTYHHRTALRGFLYKHRAEAFLEEEDNKQLLPPLFIQEMQYDDSFDGEWRPTFDYNGWDDNGITDDD